jgi:hypothetical protein
MPFSDFAGSWQVHRVLVEKILATDERGYTRILNEKPVSICVHQCLSVVDLVVNLLFRQHGVE